VVFEIFPLPTSRKVALRTKTFLLVMAKCQKTAAVMEFPANSILLSRISIHSSKQRR
jgi:hypothetical protein